MQIMRSETAMSESLCEDILGKSRCLSKANHSKMAIASMLVTLACFVSTACLNKATFDTKPHS